MESKKYHAVEQSPHRISKSKSSNTQIHDMKNYSILFDHGINPDIWLVGYIKPLYKNKGNKFNPKYYRLITILSCLG